MMTEHGKQTQKQNSNNNNNNNNNNMLLFPTMLHMLKISMFVDVP